MISGSGFSGAVFVEVPGIHAEPLRHFLRAAFCYREEIPSVVSDSDRLTWVENPLPVSILNEQTVVAGFFEGGELATRYSAWLKDPTVLLLTAIADPVVVQAAVYHHLVGCDPELPIRKPARYGTLDAFLATRSNPIASSLAQSFGRRNVSNDDFEFVAIAEDMEDSLRKLVRLLRAKASTNLDSLGIVRLRRILDVCDQYGAELSRAFGGVSVPSSDTIPQAVRDRYRRRNRHDYSFYDRARRRLAVGRDHRRRSGRGRGQGGGGTTVREPTFVFNHLPKSYGSSVREWLQQAFAIIEDHTRFLDREGAIDSEPIGVDSLASDTILCGHFCYGVHRLEFRYPEVWLNRERFRLFTFVRDPLETAISNWRHVTERYPDQAAAKPELYESVDHYLMALQNPIAERLGVKESPADLARYFFIGAAEVHVAQPEQLLAAMRDQLSTNIDSPTGMRANAALDILGRLQVRHVNAARSSSKIEISMTTRVRFEEQNALDYAIYRAALRNPREPSWEVGR